MPGEPDEPCARTGARVTIVRNSRTTVVVIMSVLRIVPFPQMSVVDVGMRGERFRDVMNVLAVRAVRVDQQRSRIERGKQHDRRQERSRQRRPAERPTQRRSSCRSAHVGSGEYSSGQPYEQVCSPQRALESIQDSGLLLRVLRLSCGSAPGKGSLGLRRSRLMRRDAKRSPSRKGRKLPRARPGEPAVRLLYWSATEELTHHPVVGPATHTEV